MRFTAKSTLGMAVRLRASVDEHGVGQEPVHELEAITLPGDRSIPAVEANHRQTIIGTILRLAGNDQMRVQVDSGKLRRLSFTLAEGAVVHVDGSSLDLIAAGDQVSAEGHNYSGAGVSAPTIFASKVVVTKTSVTH